MKRIETKKGAVVLAFALTLAVCAIAGGRELTEADWKVLNQGGIVKEITDEGGTQSASWSAKLMDHKPELMWKVITSLELYDEYMDRTTVSVLLDEATKDRVVKSGLKDADEVEKLFEGMKPGYVKHLPDGRWVIYSYQRNEFPWPVSDRWVLLEMTHDDKAMLQTWKRLAGNIKQDFGSWKLSPAEGGKTLAVNEIHIDLDIPATGPFTAFAMGVTLPDTYRFFEAMAKDMEAGKIK